MRLDIRSGHTRFFSLSSIAALPAGGSIAATSSHHQWPGRRVPGSATDIMRKYRRLLHTEIFVRAEFSGFGSITIPMANF